MKKFFILTFVSMLTLFTSACSKNNNIFTGYPDFNDNYYSSFKKDINNFQKDLNSQKVHYGDIWIRDVAPVITTKLVKFKYAPNYLPKLQSEEVDKSFMDYLDKKGFEYETSDIVLDGGNFIYNGFDTAIITKRIFKDNPNYSKVQLENKLKKLLNLNHIIFINEEPGDVLGHADGQVHFIQKDILFIGDFKGKNIVKDEIYNVLPNIKIIDIPSNYIEEGQYDENISSAKGLYINMMQTNDTIYIPKYNLKTDDEIINIVKKYTFKNIKQIDVENLSTMGGSINCLTWYCPDEFLPQ